MYHKASIGQCRRSLWRQDLILVCKSPVQLDELPSAMSRRSAPGNQLYRRPPLLSRLCTSYGNRVKIKPVHVDLVTADETSNIQGRFVDLSAWHERFPQQRSLPGGRYDRRPRAVAMPRFLSRPAVGTCASKVAKKPMDMVSSPASCFP